MPPNSIAKAFESTYRREYGFAMKSRNIIVDDLRVRGIGRSTDSSTYTGDAISATSPKPPGPLPAPEAHHEVYFEPKGLQSTPVYLRVKLQPGHVLEGPALVIDDISTVVVEPQCLARINATGDVVIDVGGVGHVEHVGVELDPV